MKRPAGPLHLVGTVPLEDTVTVLETVSAVLGSRLSRIPDGETGTRQLWIFGKIRTIADHPMIEPDGHDWSPESGSVPNRPPRYKLRDGVTPDEFGIGELGYASAAIESYSAFLRLRSQGKISRELRFQVGLPTPLAFAFAFMSVQSQAAVARAFDIQLRKEVQQIVSEIPAHDLAFQWDVCPEVFAWEGRDVYMADPRRETIDNLVRLGNLIPEGAELGFHFCYGDFNHRHAINPKDMGIMVEMANCTSEGLQRPINWVHMPVPRDRDDHSYFLPLQSLRLPNTCELYLGVIHQTDGMDGIKRRVDAAELCIRDFGLATECGFGRRPVESVVPLLELHKAAADWLTGRAG
jgi:hypothetical protein